MCHRKIRMISIAMSAVLVGSSGLVPSDAAFAASSEITPGYVMAAQPLSYGGHEYRVYTPEETGITTWDDAAKFCVKQGGHLVTISSKGEDDAVYSYLTAQGLKDAYIGLTDAETEGVWKWVNGEEVVYTNWHPGEPNRESINENYAMYYWKFSDGTWNDGDYRITGSMSGELNFICEWDNEDTSSKLSYSGHDYYVYTAEEAGITNWDEAVQFCIKQGGHLATITSKGEDNAVYAYVTAQGYKNAYIGLTDAETEGEWKWVNGEAVSYTNWHTGEPNHENVNEDYAMYYYKFTDGTWNDGDFHYKRTIGDEINFVCEWDNGDPSVVIVPDVNEFVVGDFEYKLSGNEATLIHVAATKAKITVPAKVTAPDGKSYPVTAIAKDALEDMDSTKTITIPASVTEFDEYAFRGAAKLKNIKINVTSGTSIRMAKTTFDGVKSGAKVTIIGGSKDDFKSIKSQIQESGGSNLKVKQKKA